MLRGGGHTNMFGMLDYRAHKLYAVLVYPVVFVLTLFATFVLPIIAYLVGFSLSRDLGVESTTVRTLEIVFAIVAYFLIGIPWWFIVKILVAIPTSIFNFLIDV